MAVECLDPDAAVVTDLDPYCAIAAGLGVPKRFGEHTGPVFSTNRDLRPDSVILAVTDVNAITIKVDLYALL